MTPSGPDYIIKPKLWPIFWVQFRKLSFCPMPIFEKICWISHIKFIPVFFCLPLQLFCIKIWYQPESNVTVRGALKCAIGKLSFYDESWSNNFGLSVYLLCKIFFCWKHVWKCCLSLVESKFTFIRIKSTLNWVWPSFRIKILFVFRLFIWKFVNILVLRHVSNYEKLDFYSKFSGFRDFS